MWLRDLSNDPRTLRALKTMESIKRRYCVLSAKGGVGKTTISTLLAVHLALKGVKTGLLDLDLVNPSTHVLLGLRPEDISYREEKGIEPYNPIKNLYYFTIIPYTRDQPIALRGLSAVNALWEILSIVNWGQLDILFIDTPPGMSDEHLEILTRMGERIQPLIVSTPSKLAINTLRRQVSLLREIGFKEISLVENMGKGTLADQVKPLEIKYLGYIPFIPDIDKYFGSIDGLASRELEVVTESIIANILRGDVKK